MQSFLQFYSRRDVQSELVRIAKDKEIATNFGERGFGKRPDILQYETDIRELAKQGATSFHCSEERWTSPLNLKAGMTRPQLDKIRSGFDLILDIDSKFIEYSNLTTDLIIEALKFNGIKNISCKYSGGSGFHIAIPWESLPKEINNQSTKFLFPEAPRAIAEYIKHLIKPYLSDELLKLSSLREIATSLKKKKEDLLEKEKFNPFVAVDIDPQLISSRHMIRMPYSCNEKRGLISIPINPDKVKQFKPGQAKISSIGDINKNFLRSDLSEPEEAKRLLIQALDFVQKKSKPKITIKRDYKIPKVEIPKKFFPQCIQKLLNGMKEDGRKRAVFILIAFLQHMGWQYEKIQETLLKWNKKNYEPLREGYILSQVRWFKQQPKKILPPNCAHEAYYKTLNISCANCKCKNPVNHVKIRHKH